MENDETMIAFGGALKALGDGKVGGYLVVFSDANTPDLEGDYFTKDTDFGIEDGATLPVYYAHGQDPAIKKKRIGRGTATTDDAGLWFETQLQLADDYERYIYTLAEKGKLGYSSGAASHLIERKLNGAASQIKQWVIAEASLTPRPAEPRTRGIVPIKSLQVIAAEDDTPEADPEALSGAGDAVEALKADNETVKALPIEVKDMADNVQPAPDTGEGQENEAMKSLNAKLTEQSSQIDALMKLMQDSPAINKTGFFTVDGGKADPHVKSLGDWLLSVARGDDTRLTQIYGSQKSVKDIDSTTGASGGYLVPTEFVARLLQVNPFDTPALARVQRIPVNAPSGEWPALDVFTAVTAGVGQTAPAGKVKTVKRAQSATYTETQPEFEMIRWTITDAASGYTEVSKEMRADSPMAIEALLTGLIRIAVNAKLEYLIWRGTGAGEPLGILNAPALVAVAADTADAWVYADAVDMMSHFRSTGGSPIWVAHPSAIPDIASLNIGSVTAYINNMQASLPMSLLGYPVTMSEHLTPTNAPYDIALIDPSAYLLFEKGGLYIDFSEHVGFLSGKDTWRFGYRVDGQPWMKDAITLADSGGAFEVSPFVVNNDA